VVVVATSSTNDTAAASFWRQKWQFLQQLARPRQPEVLPVSITRHRIYVLPTRFGWFMALLLAVMLLGALNYNNNPALLLALTLTSTSLGSALLAHLQLSGLQLLSLSAEPVAAGQPICLRLALGRQDRRARYGVQLRCATTTVSVHLYHDTRCEVDVYLPTQHRGWLHPGRIELSTTQPLGLLRAWCWVWPKAAVLVYPRPETHAPPLPETGLSSSQRHRHALGEELHQLRPYRLGDSRHDIAWKHSAHRNTLLVREYERPAGAEVRLDWQQLSALPYEQRIARLASWVERAEREGRRYQLHIPNQPALGPDHGMAHRHRCLRALALLPTQT